MCKSILGDTIDLHTGGVDLLFPHHENEIAQSECCNGVPLARHWYHSEHLLVDGKKMSKSLGNLYTLDDLTAKGFTPMALRYALLAGHPRKQLNFTLDSLHAAERALETLRAHRTALAPDGAAHHTFEPVLTALQDDLNFPAALGALFSIINRKEGQPDRESFDRVMFALGFDLDAVEPPAAERHLPRLPRWPRSVGPPSRPGISRRPMPCAPKLPPWAGRCSTARTATRWRWRKENDEDRMLARRSSERRWD